MESFRKGNQVRFYKIIDAKKDYKRSTNEKKKRKKKLKQNGY